MSLTSPNDGPELMAGDDDAPFAVDEVRPWWAVFRVAADGRA